MNEVELQQAKTYRDRVSTVTETGDRNWVFASKARGFFTNLRKYFAWFYLAIFFIIPLIYVNDMPLVMFNIPEAKFIIFGKIFWPQDFFVLAISMITGIVFIALFTVIFGRLFCGWACPQTIFMEFVFRKIEWAIEGSSNEQRKLRTLPWTARKIRIKLAKHSIFMAVSLLISHTFLAYIFGYKEVIVMMTEPISNHSGLFGGLVIFTLLFYAVYAYVRDIICTTICPYGRLQSVLFDKDTMQIAYDYKRGEERGFLRKNETRKDGDCIDCSKCVQVCPTGIDIRNGLQMECVGCTACVDACDEVMHKVGFEKGLIRYASENEIEGKGKFHFNRRVKSYTFLLISLFGFIAFLVAKQRPVDTIISRVKGQLFQEVGKDSVSNLFSAKIINKTNKPKVLDLRLEGSHGRIKWLSNSEKVIQRESKDELTFFVVLPNTEVQKRKIDISIAVYGNNKKIEQVKTTFLGPFK